MPRKVYLRNNCDAKTRSIVHNFTYLVLSIEASMTHMVKLIPLLADHGTVSPCANLRQTRIFLDLDSPTLIIGKMPVKPVHLMDCHNVEIFLNLFNRKEMPCNIKVHTPVCKARLVIDLYTRKTPFLGRGSFAAIEGCRKHLPECLDCIAETC